MAAQNATELLEMIPWNQSWYGVITESYSETLFIFLLFVLLLLLCFETKPAFFEFLNLSVKFENLLYDR